MLVRRLVIALIAGGLALSCGSLAVIVATIWLTPDRPRPATPTAIVALPMRATGTPRSEGPRLLTPTAVPTVPSLTPTPPAATPPATAGAPVPTPTPAATPTSLPPTATEPPSPPAPTPRPVATSTRAAAPATPTTPPTRAPTPSPTRTAPTATATPRAAPLVLTVTQLNLEPGQQASVGVSYTESGQIAWTAFSDSNWLTVSPTSGTLQGETDVLTIRAQRGDLAAGTHQGRVIVEAGGGQAVVRVTMRVPGP